jgi:hypothetical protein
VSAFRLLAALLALGLGGTAAEAAEPDHPTVYNNLDGDRDLALDRVIKEAYGRRYTITDTSGGQGFVGPAATRGDLPTTATDGHGGALAGYVVVIYLITADGRVAEPVVVRSNDQRLSQVALNAMAQWHFQPATLGGTPVASTAAQEFNFGPVDVSFGYQLVTVVTYQSSDTLVHRTPSKPELQAYLHQLADTAHRFLVGEPRAENLDIVVMLRPGKRVHCWFVSSRRPGNSPELAPLRALLEAVPSVEVRGGPVALALLGIVAGGAGQRTGTERPLPAEWREVNRGRPNPLPYASDAFMDQVWP